MVLGSLARWPSRRSGNEQRVKQKRVQKESPRQKPNPEAGECALGSEVYIHHRSPANCATAGLVPAARSHDVCNTYQLVLRQDLCLSRGSSTLGVEGGTPERPIKIEWGIRRHLQDGARMCATHIHPYRVRTCAWRSSSKRETARYPKFMVPRDWLLYPCTGYPRQHRTNTGDQRPFATTARLPTAAGNQYE